MPVSAGQAHYLGHVMRRRVGDPVVLLNGRDGEWLAEISQIKRDRAMVRVGERLREQSKPRPLTLAFAPLKRDATDLVVEKATELGATVIQPILTERSNTHRVNLERFRAIAIEAAEQCEGLDLPELREPVTLTRFLGDWPKDVPLAACWERTATAPIGGRASGLIVGPEGGFTDAELELMKRAPFVIPVSLGSRILRAETAAIAGLALLQSF